MKSNAILFRCLALGIAVVVLFFWSRSWPTHPSASPAKIGAIQPKPVGVSTPSSNAFASPALALEKGASPAAPLSRRQATLASVHEKLKQWFGSKTGDTATQETLTKELLALLTDDNTAEILQQLSPQEFSTPFGAGALERWLKIDSGAAARWIAERPDATGEHALLVARRWLAQPTELHAYCDQLPEGVWKQNVLNSASLEAVSKDPVIAIGLAQRMAPGDARTNVLETVAYDWFGRDLTAATAWTKTVEDATLRERLLAVGAKAIATADPDLAAGWLMASVKTEGVVLNETALSIVETWSEQHPAEAADWVGRFSEAGPRKAAIDLVLTHWLKSDPVAANAWIQNLPERDDLLAKLKAEQAARDHMPEAD